MKRGIAGIAVLAVGISAFSVASALAEDARVLPKGRSRVSFGFALTGDISQQYDPSGKPTSLTAPYNVELSSGNIKGAAPAIADLTNALNSLGFFYHPSQINNPLTAISKDPNGGVPLGDAISRGFLGVDGAAQQKQYIFQYQYGVSDKLSLGFGMPIINTSVNVDHSISGTNTAALAYQYFAANPGMLPSQYVSGLQTVAGINDGTLQGLLASKGYNTFGNYDGGGIGDMVLGGRYNYLNTHVHKSGDVISSAQAGVILPTGHLCDQANITEIDRGHGCFALAVANIVNYAPFEGLTLSQGLHYTHPLPAHRELRVLQNAQEFIPDATDQENVWFHLGDDVSTTLGAKYNVTKALSFGGDYAWAWHFQDVYQGSKTDRDYTYLSLNTDAYQETVQLAVSLSTIPAFMKYDFPLPADVSFTLNIPRTGRNTIITPYGLMELALYF